MDDGAFERAARLPRVVEPPNGHHELDRVLQVVAREVLVHVRGVAAAELERAVQKGVLQRRIVRAAAERRNDLAPAAHRAGEDAMRDNFHVGADPVGGGDRDVDVCNRRAAELSERLLEHVAHRRRRLVLERDGIARQQRRHDAVERGEDGIIPRRDNLDDALGHTAHLILEVAAFGQLGRKRGCRLVAQRPHLANARGDFKFCLSDLLAHRSGHGGCDGLEVLLNVVGASLDRRDALLERYRRPLRLRLRERGELRHCLLARQEFLRFRNVARVRVENDVVARRRLVEHVREASSAG
mmetsp:Transcript_26448/g.89213  ORF Transcript_26448/g.89213 Transcript_26448/m.89213 type:complete len:298 (-) Transcript_26448:56-949(-)